MAVFPGSYETYTVIGDREDLSDVIYNIDPLDCPVMASIGRGDGSNITHEWQTDQLDTAAFNIVEEAHETAFVAIVPTVRPHNFMQISEKNVIVSATNEAVRKAGRGNEMAYAIARKGKSLKRDVEFTITQDQFLAAGSSGTPRSLASIENWLGPASVGGASTSARAADGVDPTIPTTTGTPTVAVTDGTQRPLLESYLKLVIQGTWTNGGNATLIVSGAFNKSAVSTFTGNSTRYSMAQTMQLNAAIDLYVSDFGTHRVVADRFSRDRSLLVLDPTMWSIDYLRPFQQHEIAKTGDAEKRLLNTEYTLRASNHYASGVVADLTTT